MAGEDGLALPLGDEGVDPVLLDARRPGPRRPRGGRRAPASEASPGRRALEDEAADDVRVRDRETERDPGAERVAEDVRRGRRQRAAG